MECPGSLRSHLGQQITRSLSSLQLHAQILETFVHSFLDEILNLGSLQCSAGSDLNRWLASTGEIVSKCFEAHPEIARRAVENDLNVSDVINFWREAKGHNEKIFDDITNHHQSLISFGWSHLPLAEDSTQSYAIAAAEMGKKEWVRDINDWMQIQIMKFFRFGGLNSSRLSFDSL